MVDYHRVTLIFDFFIFMCFDEVIVDETSDLSKKLCLPIPKKDQRRSRKEAIFVKKFRQRSVL